MATIYSNKKYGLIKNSQLGKGNNSNFTNSNMLLYDLESWSGTHCLVSSKNSYGGTWSNDDYFIPDKFKVYIIGLKAKTITNNYLGNPGSWYCGFRTQDINGFDITPNLNLRQGATTLSRNLTNGDGYIYVNDATKWYQGSFNNVVCRAIFYPPSHPIYSEPYKYSRYEIFYDPASITQTANGDYQIKIVNSSNVSINYSSVGYSTPIGTPIGNTYAGAGYQYILAGNANIPSEWTTYFSMFTGESGGSIGGYGHLRWGTARLKFLQLVNYRYRTENSGDSAEYLSDNLFIAENPTVGDNVITNGDFETSGSGGSDIFNNWTESVPSGATLSKDTNEFHSGTSSLKYVNGTANNYMEIYQSGVLENSTWYYIEYWAKADEYIEFTNINGASLGVRFSLSGSTTSQRCISTSWEKYAIVAKSGSSTGNLSLILSPHTENSGSTIWIDDIVVKKLKYQNSDIIERTRIIK